MLRICQTRREETISSPRDTGMVSLLAARKVHLAYEV